MIDVELVKTQVAAAAGDIAEVAALVSAPEFTIDDKDAYEVAAGLVRDVRARRDALEEKRTAITRPLLDAKAAVDDLFRGPKGVLEGIETRVKSRMGEFTLREREKQRLAAEAAAASAREATSREQVVQALQQVQAMAETKAPGVSVRKVWYFEVTDASQVPSEFCSPDLVKINAAVSAGARTIPGVRVFSGSSVTVRK